MPNVESIPVFLASPSDLAEERKLTRVAAEEINRQIGLQLGLRLEIYSYEQEAPEFGRAQGRINPKVDEAELFIGLLYRKWGTPPGDDAYTSGFEEEFERAYSRRASDGTEPVIWMFFKDIEEDVVNDAGKELQKVLDFKARLENEHVLLYRRFSDTTDWYGQLLMLFMKFVVDRSVASRSMSGPDRSAGPAADEPKTTPPSVSTTDILPAVEQLDEVFERARGAARDSMSPLPPAISARLLLAGHTWASKSSAGQALGTHDVNFIFAERRELKPTADEIAEILRSMISGSDARPGWYFAAELSSSPAEFFDFIALNDRDLEVRLGAIKTLGSLATVADGFDDLPGDETGRLGSERAAELLIQSLIDTGDRQLRTAAFDLLANEDTPESLAILRAEFEDPSTPGGVEDSLAAVLARRDPLEAIDFIAEHGPLVTTETRAALLERADEITAEARNRLAQTGLGSDRRLALELANATGHLSEEAVHEALKDPADRVRHFAIDLALQHGWPISEAVFSEANRSDGARLVDFDLDYARKVRYYSSLGPDALAGDLNFYYSEPARYEAIVRTYPDLFLARARRDIDDVFAQFKAESAVEIESRFGSVGTEKLVHERDSTVVMFLRAALSGLAKSGDHEDAERVRRFVGHQDRGVAFAAAKALGHVGTQSDLSTVVEAANQGFFIDRQVELAHAALQLSPDAAVALASANEAALVRIGLNAIADAAVAIEVSSQHLHHQDAKVRLAAVSRLFELLDERALEAVLEEYMTGANFYNVVTWFDRLLYAPEPYVTRYQRELASLV